MRDAQYSIQCQQAIDAASRASDPAWQGAGEDAWVYSIAYGATKGGCRTDQGNGGGNGEGEVP